jgi:hypothetical protein
VNVFKGYKTLIVNLLLIGAGILQEMAVYFTNLPADVGPVMIAMGAANIVLRILTTTPIGQKRPQS